MIICIQTDRHEKKCAAYGEPYREAMERARVPSSPDRACFNNDSQGWKDAAEIVKLLPAEVKRAFLPAVVTAAEPTPEQLPLVEARRDVCRGCDQNRSISERLPNVGCKLCGCGGLSLISGTCRLGKWPM